MTHFQVVWTEQSGFQVAGPLSLLFQVRVSRHGGGAGGAPHVLPLRGAQGLPARGRGAHGRAADGGRRQGEPPPLLHQHARGAEQARRDARENHGGKTRCETEVRAFLLASQGIFAGKSFTLKFYIGQRRRLPESDRNERPFAEAVAVGLRFMFLFVVAECVESKCDVVREDLYDMRSSHTQFRVSFWC